MHVLFDNQVSKPTYAPDFIPGINHRYYDWLLAASDHYDLIGDKMAFSSIHFGYCAPNDIMAFYEARFFASRYVFTLREPVQNLLSCLKLIGKDDAVSLRTLMVAWLDFIKFWADWIRTFPHTLTLAGALDKQKVQQLLGFLSIESPDAWLLLDDEERRLHLDAGRYEDLALHADALSDIYQHALAAITDDTVLWERPRSGRLR